VDNPIKIGIIGDYNEKTVSHPAMNASLKHSAAALAVQIDADWLPTGLFNTPEGRRRLEDFDSYWIASGDPQNVEGAITGIRIARETGKPLIGT
jgi:CTP synthase (UTP-ammonia lyase)